MQGKFNCGGQVAFVFRLPAGQVEFSGLFLTLFRREKHTLANSPSVQKLTALKFSLNKFDCQNIYSNGVGSQVLTIVL